MGQVTSRTIRSDQFPNTVYTVCQLAPDKGTRPKVGTGPRTGPWAGEKPTLQQPLFSPNVFRSDSSGRVLVSVPPHGRQGEEENYGGFHAALVRTMPRADTHSDGCSPIKRAAEKPGRTMAPHRPVNSALGPETSVRETTGEETGTSGGDGQEGTTAPTCDVALVDSPTLT